MRTGTDILDRMHHIEIITQLEGQNLEHLRDLVEAATRADGHEPLGEHKFLRMKHGDDLALGMMALEGERLVGYAHTLWYADDGERRVSCEMVVHPDLRRQGLGRRLLAKVVEHAESQGASELTVWAYNDSAVSRHFAAEFGLSAGRHLMHMHRHPGSPPYLAAPEGAAIRSFRAGQDEQALLRLNNRIFEEHPENGAWTMEDLWGRMIQPWFRAEDVLMLEVHGRLAGFCWLKVEERRDEGI
jgi:mycothiol synthase